MHLPASASVIRVDRLRTVSGIRFIREMIVLPRALFSGLERETSLPNTLYDLFQRRFGVTIAHADEKISTASADQVDADALSIAIGAPLMVIDRIAVAIDGTPIEWRVSRCHMVGRSYNIQLA